MDPQQLEPGKEYLDLRAGCKLIFVSPLPLRRDGEVVYSFQRLSTTSQATLREEYIVNNLSPIDPPQIPSTMLKRSKTMDQNIAAILRDDTTTIEVSVSSGGYYTYVTNLPVKLGDLVVVPMGTNDEFKVCPVVKVHDELRIEPNSEIQYKWVVQVVDLTDYHTNLEKNGLIERTMATTYQKTARAAFRQSALQCASDEDRAKLEAILSTTQPRLGS